VLVGTSRPFRFLCARTQSAMRSSPDPRGRNVPCGQPPDNPGAGDRRMADGDDVLQLGLEDTGQACASAHDLLHAPSRPARRERCWRTCRNSRWRPRPRARRSLLTWRKRRPWGVLGQWLRRARRGIEGQARTRWSSRTVLAPPWWVGGWWLVGWCEGGRGGGGGGTTVK
jgi:hypothetical protein